MRVQELFLLTKKDITIFWNIFKRFDTERIGVITRNDFFDKLVFEKRGMLGDAVFELVDVEDNEKMCFGEFVQAVCTFCFFEQPEILKCVSAIGLSCAPSPHPPLLGHIATVFASSS